MKSTCPKCENLLSVSQGGYVRKKWGPNNNNLFDYSEVKITHPPVCAVCSSNLSIESLSAIGLKNISPDKTRAQGTKFYNVYESAPDLYDKFSWSEDTEGKISSFMKKMCRKEFRVLDIGSGTE